MLIEEISITTGRRRTDVKDERGNAFWVEYSPGRITVELLDRYEAARKNNAVDIHLITDTLLNFLTDWDVQYRHPVLDDNGVETFETVIDTAPITEKYLKTMRLEVLSLILNAILEDINRPEKPGETKGTNSRSTSKQVATSGASPVGTKR